MSLGNKVADARREKNLTQEQLAELIGVTRQSVSRWESDLAYPEMDKIILLSEILGVSCDYLLKDGWEAGGSPANPVTRLLRQMLGKQIKLEFYRDSSDSDLDGIVCKIVEFDGQWMHVAYTKKKKEMTKLIPVSSILSLKIMEKEGD